MSDLQFDRAEGTGGAATEPKCAVCDQPIRDTYFEVNGRVLCARCRSQAEQQLAAGTSAGRFGKALLFGLGAAAAGTALYYGVLAATGYELGIIAIVVGFMVGTAVKKGSNGRGGWRYQALAIFLTYTSIVSSFVPLLYQELAKQDQAVVVDQKGEENAELVAAADDTASAVAADSVILDDAEAIQINPFAAIVIAIGFVYALPFLAGIENIIGLVIIAIALYEAWKINKRPVLVIAGPFKVGQAR